MLASHNGICQMARAVALSYVLLLLPTFTGSVHAYMDVWPMPGLLEPTLVVSWFPRSNLPE